MEIFGSIERLMSDLYPYRYALGAVTVAVAVLVAWLAWRRGWHMVARRHPKTTLITTVVALAIAIPLGNYLLSPLWTRTTLEEESPLALLTSGSAAQAATSTTAPAASTPTAMAMAATVTPAPAAPSATAPTTPSGGGTSTADEPTAVPALPDATATTEPPQPTEAPAEPEPEATATEIPPTPEPEPVAFEPHVTHSGEFYGADDFHFGQGTALIIEVEPGRYVLRFEEFSVRNGPDLYVYLSTNPDGASANDYNVGALKATDGSFNYDIPEGVDISIYRSVIIWCEPFAVLFATAPLFPAE